MNTTILKIFPSFLLFSILSTHDLINLESQLPIQKGQVKLKEDKLSSGPEIHPDFANIPLYFIPNKGQVHEKALIYTKTSGYM